MIFEKAVSPLSVTPENFTVYNNYDGTPMTVTDAVYIPTEKKTVLTVNPEYISGFTCKTESNSLVTYVDGSSATGIYSGELSEKNTGSTYNVFVTSPEIYGRRGRLLCFGEEKTYTIKIEAVNTSSKEQKRQLTLYLNSNVTTSLLSEEITVAADTTKTYSFEINGEGLGKADRIFANLK